MSFKIYQDKVFIEKNKNYKMGGIILSLILVNLNMTTHNKLNSNIYRNLYAHINKNIYIYISNVILRVTRDPFKEY